MKRRELMDYCEAIAAMFGAEVVWMYGDKGGYWDYGTKIYVSRGTDTHRRMISTFCHELGHYLNRMEGKYPLYHIHYRKLYSSFKTRAQAVAYAHRAEVFTEQRGRQLAKDFFPGVKYKAFYKTGSKKSLGFMMGYHWINQ